MPAQEPVRWRISHTDSEQSHTIETALSGANLQGGMERIAAAITTAAARLPKTGSQAAT
jgi:hypothetical protein